MAQIHNGMESFDQPIRVEPMRVRRTYHGGANIDLWHNQQIDRTGQRPEEWLASVTPAVNPGFPEEREEGLSQVWWQGNRCLLRDLIAAFPQEMLGQDHLVAVGQNPGILAKMVDSAERLSIQVHPDKAFSRQYFQSEYGKTECWYILRTTPVGDQKPCLYMGFRPGVTKERWQRLYEIQDIQGMLDCMHCITPHPGDVWLIEGGVPHAIGPGCCLIELQEPTDYTLRTEKKGTDGRLLPEQLIHQGAGEKGLLECFHYEGLEEKELWYRYRMTPQTRRLPDGGIWQKLVGPPRTDCFSMATIWVEKKSSFPPGNHFSVAVVLDGTGSLCTATSNTTICRGEHFFLPADMGAFSVVNHTSDRPLHVLFCYPPYGQVLPPQEI